MDLRYLKRMSAYWARKERMARARLDRLDFTTWFDLWHTHPDLRSKGNRCTENRASVAEITYRLLRYSEQLSVTRGSLIQVFATISADTGSKAVYVHTANPNGTPFPHPLDNVRWGVDTPPELSSAIDLAIHEVGQTQGVSSAEYVIRSRVALPVE